MTLHEHEDETPLGTIALDQRCDKQLWRPDELHHALVIHRLIVDHDAAGDGFGKALLQHAERLAAARGLRRLVLDAEPPTWTSTNATSEPASSMSRPEPGVVSGALFQHGVHSPC